MKDQLKADYAELKALLSVSLEEDFDKFINKSNNAAGTRVRLAMQSLKISAQKVRVGVQTLKNAE